MEQAPITFAEWTTLLELAVSDRVVPSLDRIGGIEQFIKATTRRSPEMSAARVMRDAALDDFFSRVTLTVADARRTAHYLDLAAAFKPKTGILPVADFVRRHLRISALLREGVFVTDMRLRGLQVLEAYFPMPPLDQSPAYTSYVELLKQYATLTSYSGYALARLLELHSVTLRDPLAKIAVRTADAQALGELVQRILTYNLDEVAREKLGEVYNLAIATSQLHLFSEAVERNNGKLETPTSKPELQIGGRTLSLYFSVESQAHAVESVDFGAAMREFVSGERDDEDRA